MTEAPAEPPVRLGPAAANVARAIWHQKELLVLGLVLGLALGWLALPKVLRSGSTYDATIRLQVLQPPADAIQKVPPAVGQAAEDSAGASPEVLKNVAVATQVVDYLRKTRRLGSEDELTGPLLLDRLSVTPLEGTPLVDLAFTDGNAMLARAVVEHYADQFASNRNKFEASRLKKVLGELEALADSLNKPTTSGEPSPAAQEVRNQIRLARVSQVVGGEPTQVFGPSIVATNAPPLSRNVMLALGLLLGLGLGAGAGLLAETAFRKVATPTDAEEASGLPFIGEVRRAGIRRTPLPVIDRPFSPAAEDYRRVGTALERQGLGTDIRVLAICSAEPGDGRTMLATNLAHSLARQGREVVLVSSDLRRQAVEKLLGLGQGPGLAEALHDDPIPAIAMLVSINDHLLVLPAGMPSKHPGELLASRRLNEAVQTLRQMGIIILDTPPARNSADAITLSSVADATLFVAKSGATRMRSMREATNGLRRDRIRQLGVILVGTRNSRLRSVTTRGGDLRDQPDAELEDLEPMPPPRTVPFSPRPAASGQEPDGNGDRALEVTGLNKAAERNRRAAE